MQQASMDTRVISMKRSVDRQTKITDLLQKCNVSFDFFDGYDVAAMDPGEVASLREFHTPFDGMTNSELGCDLSHYYLLKDWIENRTSDYILVLEDDAFFDENLAGLFDQIHVFDELKFDILKIGGDKTRNKRVSAFLRRAFRGEVVYPFSPSFSTVGYVVSRRNAHLVLKHMEKIFVQIDVRLFKHCPIGIAILETSPFLVLQSGDQSTISHRIFISKKSLMTRLMAHLNFEWVTEPGV